MTCPEDIIHLTKDMGTDASFALTLSSLAGLSTATGGIIAIFMCRPEGALLGYAILRPFLSPDVSHGLLAFAGGIMVYISLDELLPAAFEYGEAHFTMIGIIIGMMVMAASQIGRLSKLRST
jgi:zinc transporter ZupT